MEGEENLSGGGGGGGGITLMGCVDLRGSYTRSLPSLHTVAHSRLHGLQARLNTCSGKKVDMVTP